MEVTFNGVLIGFVLTAIAGLATAIGSVIAFFTKTTNTKFLASALGFSAGVMIYISFVELLAGAHNSLQETFGKAGGYYTLAAFFGGILLSLAIDRLIPEYENPHEVRKVEEMDRPGDRKKLLRSGLFFAFAMALHNFPEGMATFVASLENPSTGISIAVAIAIHNIPEGITVSVPVYHATNSRKKAFMISALSGIAEPFGALIAFLFLLPFLSATLLSLLFACVAGVMVFISFDELLPLAEAYGEHHKTIYGFILGMLVMALTLIH